MNILRYIAFFVLITHLSCGEKQKEYDVTFETLLEEMIDRDEIPKTPINDYTLGQASSYDRSSKSPSQGWYANKDGGGMIRTEVNSGRSEHVLMGVEGAGAIVRFWSTNLTWLFSNGTLRFYFDGSDTPQIEGKFLDILGGNMLADGILSTKTGGFQENHEGKAYILSAVNLYLPIPYAKSCKVTYEGTDSPFYFIINYRKYAKGTKVRTFSMNDLKKSAKKIAAVQNELVTNKSGGGVKTSLKEYKTKTIKAGEKVSYQIDGERAIREFMMKIDAGDFRQALRSTIVEIKFDDQSRVWSPAGDFFCTGYNLAKQFETRYHKVSWDGRMLSRWIMPFRKKAEIIIHNLGEQSVTIDEMSVAYSDWKWDDRSMYFHADWRVYSEIPSHPHRDMNFITIKGKGKYVGDCLSIYNAVVNGGREPWWGEGDEKIYIDGESFPSIFGTGTEDYYGYAWVGCATFSQPFLSQPIAHGNRGQGLTVNSRVRSLDAMPFNTSLHFDMELWHWADGTNVDYAPTCFWYGAEDAESVMGKGSVKKRSNDVDGAKRAVRFNDLIEAEGLSFETQGEAKYVVFTKPTTPEFSNRSVLLISNLRKGGAIKGSFYSDKKRTGTLKVVAHKRSDSPTVDLLLNGKTISEDLKLEGEGELVLNLPNISFDEGKNTLSVLGKENGKNKIAIDYFQMLD